MLGGCAACCPAVNFLLIDDHPIIRESLRLTLGALFPRAELSEAASAGEAMRVLPTRRWAVIVLDLDLPDRSGLDLLKDVQNLAPDAPVLVFSGRGEGEYGRRVLATGAMGFLSKLSTAAQIEAAVRRILSGHKYISPDLAESIIGHPQTMDGVPPHAALSSRELEVLKLYATGVAPAGIAQRLKISAKTVSTYRTRILEKLELGSTADLIRYAVQHHLAD